MLLNASGKGFTSNNARLSKFVDTRQDSSSRVPHSANVDANRPKIPVERSCEFVIELLIYEPEIPKALIKRSEVQ